MRRIVAVALGGFVVTAAAAAQQPPVFQVDVDMTNVTVTVTDSHGKLVSDLEPDDFVVREDGRVQKVLLFAPAGRPENRDELALNLGLLFDTSGSMRQELRLSKESAIRFLDAIPRAKDLLLVFFDRDIRISRYASENQQGIFDRILETEGEGLTALYDAITVYVSRVMDSPGRKVLVLFTDGDDTTSNTTEGDVERMIRASDVVVYPVEFRGDQRPNSPRAMQAHAFLAGLATASGGRVFQPQASRELAKIYETILGELGSQYVLGYVSDNPAHDGRYRKLDVRVSRPGLKVRYRPGYDAPKDEPAPQAKAK